MELIDRTCVNSKWVARFLAKHDQECCECPGCKVRCRDSRGHEYVLTGQEYEIERLRDALSDCASGLKYIRQQHGDLYGVGFDRALGKADAILSPNY